jgi:hypothetical protein
MEIAAIKVRLDRLERDNDKIKHKLEIM